MKLWLLIPTDGRAAAHELREESNPWHPWYDKCFGMVVRAASEAEARVLADRDAGDENRVGEDTAARHPWLDPKLSKCDELATDGAPDVILQDVHNA